MCHFEQPSGLALLLVGIVAVSQQQFPEVSILLQRHTTFFKDGDTIALSCDTNGSITGISWKKDSENLDNNINYTAFYSFTNSLLTIRSFRVALEGNYTCVATSDEGIVSSPSLWLQKTFIKSTPHSLNFDNPHQFTVRAGMPIFLTCGNFSSQPTATVLWERAYTRTKMFRLDPSKEEVSPDGKLFLPEPQLEDSGKIYRCVVRNNVILARLAGFVKIKVVANTNPPTPITVWVTPSGARVAPGETHGFYCFPGGRGASQARVTWQYPEFTEPHLFDQNHTLFVLSASHMDTGIYSCMVEEQIHSAVLLVIEPPVLTSSLSPVSIMYTETLTLSCAASSNVDLWWEWFFNGTRLLNQVDSTLVISSTTERNHGTYQCIARNRAGFKQSATAVQIKVIGATFNGLLPTKVITFRGMPLLLLCHAYGFPPPQFLWSKLSGSAFFNATEGEYLVIPELEVNDAGRYQCMIRTILSDGTVYKNISDYTDIRVIEPTILLDPNRDTLEARVGSRIAVSCAVNHSSEAIISYHWLKNGESIFSSSQLKLIRMERDFQLVIEQVSYNDEGRYQCIVTTSVGSFDAPEVKTSDIALVVLNSSPVPSIDLLNQTSHNSFEVQWYFHGDMAQVSHYLIQVQIASQTSSNWSSLLELPKNVKSVEVSDPTLVGYTKYKVRVVVVFLDGSSVHSEPRSVTTGIAAPLDSPRDLRIKFLNNTSLQLSWKASKIPQGPIISYIIRYRKPDDIALFVMVNGTVESLTLTGLQDPGRYTIQVAAVTEAGVGPYTVAINAPSVRFPGSSISLFVQPFAFITLVVSMML